MPIDIREKENPVVGIVGGSTSDFPILKKAVELLEDLAVESELRVVSAHRTPDWLFEYAENAEDRGIKVIIAGAGGAAHLPGMLAAKTILPIIGVPVPLEHLRLKLSQCNGECDKMRNLWNNKRVVENVFFKNPLCASHVYYGFWGSNVW